MKKFKTTLLQKLTLAILVCLSLGSWTKSHSANPSSLDKNSKNNPSSKSKIIQEFSPPFIEESFAELINKVIPSEPQVIEGIDYSNLSIEDALKRMLEIDFDIKIQKLLTEKERLRLKREKREVRFPRISAEGLILKSLAGDEKEGFIFAEQIKALVTFDSNTSKRINRRRTSYKLEELRIEEITSEKTKKLIESYLVVALSQQGLDIYQDAYREFKESLITMENNPRYSEIDIMQIRYFLARVFEGQLVAYERLKTAQRELKLLLGWEDNDNLIIRTAALPEDIKGATSFVEKSNLKQKKYLLGVVEKSIEEARIIEKTGYQPLLGVAIVTTGNYSHGTGENNPTAKRSVSSISLDVYILDFGYSRYFKETNHLRREVLELFLAKENRDLEDSNAEIKYKLNNLEQKIKSSRNYIAELERALDILKERIELPVNVLFKKNKQFMEAKHVLEESLWDYTFSLSQTNPEKLIGVAVSGQYHNLSFEEIINLAENNKTFPEQIAAKNTAAENATLKSTEKIDNPNLRTKFSYEYEDEIFKSGNSLDRVRISVSLGGRFLNKGQKFNIKAAQAHRDNAKYQEQALINNKYTEIIKHYLKALQFQRRVSINKKIMELKDTTIQEMLSGMEGNSPKYGESNILTLILEQLEGEMAILKWGAEISESKNIIKKLCAIPLGEGLTLQDIDYFKNEQSMEKFIEIVRRKVTPLYNAEAALKSALSTVEEFNFREREKISSRGAFWRFFMEGRSSAPEVLDRTQYYDAQVGITLQIPFASNDKTEIERAKEKRNRHQAELTLAKAQKELEATKADIKLRYQSSKIMLEGLGRDRKILQNQQELINTLVGTGVYTERTLTDAKMRLLALELDYESKVQEHLLAWSRHILVFPGQQMPQKEKKGSRQTYKVNNLKESIAMALKNSKEIKAYYDILKTEQGLLKHYKKIYLTGSITGEEIYLGETQSEPADHRDAPSFVALANLDVDLTNRQLIERQKLKIKIKELDLGMMKMEVVLKVISAYANYMENMSEYAVTSERYRREKNILEHSRVQAEAGMMTRMDFLRKEQVANMLYQKLLSIQENTALSRRNFSLVIGGLDPYLSILGFEILDENGEINIPVGTEEKIKIKLEDDFRKIKDEIILPLEKELSEYINFEISVAELETQIAGKKIRSITSNVGYAHLKDGLREITLFNESALALNLLLDEDIRTLKEFVSLHPGINIYRPTDKINIQIKKVEKKIAEFSARRDMLDISQEVKTLFDAYEINLLNYQYAARVMLPVEISMQEKLANIRERGEFNVIEEMEIIGMMVRISTDRMKASYRLTGTLNQLDQHLKKYTGKGIYRDERSPVTRKGTWEYDLF